jgi:hypothetical protein
MDTWTIVGAWLTAGLTLAMYSFLYGDNPFFKIAEHIYLGVSVGYLIVSTHYQYIMPKLWTPIREGHYELIVPALLGILILTRLIPRLAWLSRISFAAIMGYTAGLYVPTAVRQFLLPQVGNTIQPLNFAALGGVKNASFNWAALGELVNGLLILIGVVAVLVHFFYSVEHKGAIKHTARLGVLFLMFAFGAMFGYTTMGRMSLLFGVTYQMVTYADARYYFATPVLLAIMIAGLVIWERTRPPEVPSESETI